MAIRCLAEYRLLPFSRTDTFGHFWTPWALGALHKFHPACMSLASQVMSQWSKRSYSLQRQGRLGKTPRLGPRGQFSEARSFHSFNENVALHIISYYVALPETNIERKSTCMMSKFRIDLMKPLQKLPNGIHAEALALCTMLLDSGVPLNHADVAWLQLCMFSLRLCCWNSAVLLWYLG